MTKLSKAADFLQNMNLSDPEPVEAVTEVEPRQAKGEQATNAAKKAVSTRAGLKHIGGYFDLETVEKVAVLRARLRLDNSELIKLAIDELHRKHLAKRAYGDA